jgi:hypothetical protein
LASSTVLLIALVLVVGLLLSSVVIVRAFLPHGTEALGEALLRSLHVTWRVPSQVQVALEMSWKAAKATANTLYRVAKHALLTPLYVTRILITASAAEGVIILIVLVGGVYLLRGQLASLSRASFTILKGPKGGHQSEHPFHHQHQQFRPNTKPWEQQQQQQQQQQQRKPNRVHVVFLHNPRTRHDLE